MSSRESKEREGHSITIKGKCSVGSNDDEEGHSITIKDKCRESQTHEGHSITIKGKCPVESQKNVKVTVLLSKGNVQ